MRKSNMGICKSCGKQIVWIKTKGGKNMPCDPTFRYYSSEGTKERIVTTTGDVVSCTITDQQEGSIGFGYVPHWSTCPQAGRYRK